MAQRWPIDIQGVDPIRLLGSGGFGEVWLARQPALDRQVAVKIGHRPFATADDRRRFERECLALGRLSGHAHIVDVHTSGVIDGLPYLVLEYIEGGTLADRDRNWAENDLRRLTAELTDAVGAAHAIGVLHRDLKPENVFLRSTGASVLGDFGIARIGDGNNTSAPGVTASMAFAAPEILNGHPPSEVADVYGIGITIVSTVLGESPFVGGGVATLEAIVASVLRGASPDLEQHGLSVPFSTLLRRTINPDPARRPPTAAALAAELAALDEVGPATRAAGHDRTGPGAGGVRYRAPFTSGGAIGAPPGPSTTGAGGASSAPPRSSAALAGGASSAPAGPNPTGTGGTGGAATPTGPNPTGTGGAIGAPAGPGSDLRGAATVGPAGPIGRGSSRGGGGGGRLVLASAAAVVGLGLIGILAWLAAGWGDEPEATESAGIDAEADLAATDGGPSSTGSTSATTEAAEESATEESVTDAEADLAGSTSTTGLLPLTVPLVGSTISDLTRIPIDTGGVDALTGPADSPQFCNNRPDITGLVETTAGIYPADPTVPVDGTLVFVQVAQRMHRFGTAEQADAFVESYVALVDCESWEDDTLTSDGTSVLRATVVDTGADYGDQTRRVDQVVTLPIGAEIHSRTVLVRRGVDVFKLFLTTDRAEELEPSTEALVAAAIEQLGY
ncbi:MAG: serine/threonine-protein kinase [Actinomycetota bacterium]